MWYCYHCQSGGKLKSALPFIRTHKVNDTVKVPEWHKYLVKIPGNPQVDKFLEKYPNLWRSQIVTWEIFGKIYMSPLEETVLKPLNKEDTPLTLVSGNLLLRGNNTVIIVEDFISGYCVHNAGFSVLILNGTSLQQPDKLVGFEEILVWLDGDWLPEYTTDSEWHSKSAGIQAAKKLQTKYGWRCIITKQDPKYYSNEDILKYLND